MKKFLLAIAIISSGGLLQSNPVMANASVRQEISVAEPTMRVCNGGLELTCPPDGKVYTFQIYAITGQLVKKIQLSESTATVELAKGCYIVKCDSWVKKAVVI